MEEFRKGKVHSGSKNGPIVTSRKQAIAIAISENAKLHPNGSIKRSHSETTGTKKHKPK